jgi:ABC-type uncharacterized transport system involved in gliding motility auxiliary subunit
MRQHALRYTVSGIIAVVLVAALVVMANWLAARRWARADLTSTKIYTLSEKTENILADLTEEVRVVVFMTPATSMYDQVHELLQRYQAASSRLQVEFIDPDREPLRTKQLAEQFGVQVANTVVFALGERTKYVTAEQMAEMDYSGMQVGQGPTVRAFKGEEQFTSAILSLVAPEVPKVYFVTGHGEAAVAAGAGADRSVSLLAEALKRENMEAADTTLLSGEVPLDADILAIAGPTRAFTEPEIAAIDAFLDGGGRLLVALDPLIEPTGTMRPTRLEGLLAARGVTVHDDLVVDPSRRLPFYDLSAVYLQDFPSHPATEGLEGFAVLFTVARSLAPAGEGAQPLVRTSDQGWGETDLGMLLRGEPVALDDSDVPGPAVVAVAVEKPPEAETGEAAAGDDAAGGGARLVVFGDSDFLTDIDLANAGNSVLALNAFNWLGAREALLGIPPREVEQVSLFLDQQQLRTILLLVLVVMPGAAILAGVLVWRKRRH